MEQFREQEPQMQEPSPNRPENIQKEPWEMTKEEFLESAERGQMHKNEKEDIITVAEGTKPVAVIAYPNNVELPEMKLLQKPDIAEKVEYRLFTHPGSPRRVAIVAPKGADLDQLVKTYIGFFYINEGGKLKLKPDLKETPRSAIEQGKFYGYSQDDINYYLNRTFGYDEVVKDHQNNEIKL